MHEIKVPIAGDRVADMLGWCMDTFARDSFRVIQYYHNGIQQKTSERILTASNWHRLFMYHPSYDDLIIPNYQRSTFTILCNLQFDNEEDAMLFRLTWG